MARFSSLFALALLGCSAHDDAMGAFREARYPDALAAFRAAEADVRGHGERERLRYALYRGLAHLAVGDLLAAELWLGYAKAAWDREPTVFDDEERGRLLSAWRAMGRMPGQALAAW